MPVEVLTGFEKKFNTTVIEGYGLSETSPVAVFNKLDCPRAGSIGFPVWGVEIKITDETGAEVEGRRTRRNLHSRTQHYERLLQKTGSDRRRD